MEINKIYNEDCLDTMARMSDNFVDLTVTSPPYDNLRTYNSGIGLSWGEHVWKPLIDDLHRVTKEGGVVVWVVSDATVEGSETGTSFNQALYFKEAGFDLYDTMIWEKPSPQAPTEGRYYNVFEYMFVFSKGKPKTLNLLADRKNKSFGQSSKRETRSCKEDRRYTGETRTVKEYSRRFNVWIVSRGSSKTIHPAVFPEQLANDHILSWSNKGDLVYDPFMGSGTTAKMSLLNERNYIGSEISSDYCEICDLRLEKVRDQITQESGLDFLFGEPDGNK